MDFTPIPQNVVFPVGSVAGERRCLNIPLSDNISVELAENFSVRADSSDPNAEFSPGGDIAVLTITDNDSKKLFG